MDLEANARRREGVIMGSGTLIGFAVNMFAIGFILVGVGKLWDKLGSTMNYLNSIGMATQMGMDTANLITIIFYASGMICIIAGVLNVIIESKRDFTRRT